MKQFSRRSFIKNTGGAGFALWLTYGFLLGQWPLIVTNAICLLLSAFIFLMKLLSPHARDVVADALDVAPKDG